MKQTIAPQALKELEEAALFYAERGGKELGLAFLAEFYRVRLPSGGGGRHVSARFSSAAVVLELFADAG